MDVFVGQVGDLRIELTDQNSRPTDLWDQAAGVRVDAPGGITVADIDENPLDAEVRFEAETSGRITVTLDGDPGADVREITLQSEDLTVRQPPPGEATGGRVTITLRQVDQPA